MTMVEILHKTLKNIKTIRSSQLVHKFVLVDNVLSKVDIVNVLIKTNSVGHGLV